MTTSCSTCRVSFSQAALGAQFTIPTAYGEEEIRVPPGTQPETVLRLKGRGLPVLGQSSKGDLLIRVQVWTPERLTDEQERLFRQLATLEGEPAQALARVLVQAQGSARRMTWWAIDVRAAPEERERLGAWLVARTGQAVEERDDGTLVTFAPDDATADRLIAELGRETKAPTETSRRRIEPVDWSTRWRDGLGPRRFGRLTVTPSWVSPAGTGTVRWSCSIPRRPSAAASTARPGSRSRCWSGWSAPATTSWTSAAAAASWPSLR